MNINQSIKSKLSTVDRYQHPSVSNEQPKMEMTKLITEIQDTCSKDNMFKALAEYAPTIPITY